MPFCQVNREDKPLLDDDLPQRLWSKVSLARLIGVWVKWSTTRCSHEVQSVVHEVIEVCWQ